MMRNQTTKFGRSAAECFFGSIALALVTLACFRFQVGLATTAFVPLIGIVLLSLMGSFFVSAILSSQAIASLNYLFAPPLLSFHIDYPLDVVLLIIFLLTSFNVSGLVERMRKQTEASLRTQRPLFHPPIRALCHYCHRLRCRDHQRECGPPVHRLFHHQIGRHGHRTVNLPFDNRSS
jgi:K+-sensing histidine kinase KdpD